MVQRYRCATVMIVQGMDSGQHEGEMKPDPRGDWVPLSEYNSDIAQLNAEINRLLVIVDQFEKRIDLNVELHKKLKATGQFKAATMESFRRVLGN